MRSHWLQRSLNIQKPIPYRARSGHARSNGISNVFNEPLTIWDSLRLGCLAPSICPASMSHCRYPFGQSPQVFFWSQHTIQELQESGLDNVAALDAHQNSCFCAFLLRSRYLHKVLRFAFVVVMPVQGLHERCHVRE